MTVNPSTTDVSDVAPAGVLVVRYRLNVVCNPVGEVSMATKDKNSKKSMEKKPAQKTLKEKRQARKDKK